jgi:CxxC motif-containing protein
MKDMDLGKQFFSNTAHKLLQNKSFGQLDKIYPIRTLNSQPQKDLYKEQELTETLRILVTSINTRKAEYATLKTKKTSKKQNNDDETSSNNCYKWLQNNKIKFGLIAGLTTMVAKEGYIPSPVTSDSTLTGEFSETQID